MVNVIISRIEIADLYGQYTYLIPEDGMLSNASIIYGDNGVGKSTILRLTFHILSSADNKGHRNALSKVSYRYFSVHLSSGYKITAERTNPSVPASTLRLTVERKNRILAEWNYNPDKRSGLHRFIERDGNLIVLDDDDEIHQFERKSKGPSHPRGEAAYLAALKEAVPTLFFVSADRKLESDSISDPSDEMELRRLVKLEEPKRIVDLLNRTREVALAQAMTSAARWIQRKAVVSTNLGSTNVHSVYLNVVRHLTGNKSRPEDTSIVDRDLNDFLDRLDFVESRTADLARYELSASLNLREFKKAISQGSKSDNNLAANVLTPYLDSLEGRLNALNPLYKIVDTFVNVINRFLNRKNITYRATQGFTITNDVGDRLEPGQLSSGEQQLILLFCYVLVARDIPSVFMIDEPEISLNVKWQRQLLQSLLEVTEGANIQFMLASHSLELISLHRDRVVRLVNSKI